MKEYRTTLELEDKGYTYVELGPIPDKPSWHRELYARQTYPFPTPEAAERFAAAERDRNPGREVILR